MAEIQFNMEEETLCAVAQNTEIEYIHFYPDGGMKAVTTSRHAHDRDLTDLSWHDHEKNVIASWYVGPIFAMLDMGIKFVNV